MDFKNMIAQLSGDEKHQAKIGVFTDPNVARLPVMKVVEESLMKEGLNFVIFDKISVEPTDNSWQVSTTARTRHWLGLDYYGSMADVVASD